MILLSPEYDHTSAGLDAWNWLDSPAAAPLLEATEGVAEPSARLVSGLRKQWPAEVVSAALELARARVKSREKFPDQPGLWCDVPGVEQASSALVASWKAKRFERSQVERAVDLCCGIGGDAMSLSRVVDLLAVDIDPLRTWMTQRNAKCATQTIDMRDVAVEDVILHIDPARREEATGRRLWTLDAYRPPWQELLGVIARARGVSCKLGPGVPVPLEGVPPESELEFIQEGGRLVQAVLWTGELATAQHARRATLLPSGDSLLGSVEPIPQTDDVEPNEGEFLLEPRPALERAGLIGCALRSQPGEPREAAPGLGLILCDQPASTPWFLTWQIHAVLPMRERAVKTWLREHDGGELIARTRAGAIDVDHWSRALRGKGGTQFTVFGLRLGSEMRAIVCQPPE